MKRDIKTRVSRRPVTERMSFAKHVADRRLEPEVGKKAQQARSEDSV